MTKILLVSLCLVFVALPRRGTAQADTIGVRESISEFRVAWRDAWTRRDVNTLASLVADDVDWIAADGTWLKGRAAFQQHHSRLFAVQFQNAKWKLLDEKLEIVDRDLVITVTATQIDGDTDASGVRRQPRSSVGTRVIVRQDGKWRLKTSHNTLIAPIPPATR